MVSWETRLCSRWVPALAGALLLASCGGSAPPPPPPPPPAGPEVGPTPFVFGVDLDTVQAGVFDQGFFALKADTVFLDKYARATLAPDMLPGGIPADAYDDLESERAVGLASRVLDFVSERAGSA